MSKRRSTRLDQIRRRPRARACRSWQPSIGSLLATRSVTYMESFTRVSMFLSVLTGSVVALALFAQVDHFHETFLVAAIFILLVVVFVGLVTISRVNALNRENFRWITGMNRLRHAYLEMYPDLEPYFVASSHDDLRGFALTMSLPIASRLSPLASAAQGFQSLPAMLTVIVTLVTGLLGALVAAWFGASTVIAVLVAAIVFRLTVVIIGLVSQRAFFVFAREVPARFPSPGESPSAG